MYKTLIPEDIAQSGKQYLTDRGYELRVGVPMDVKSLRREIGDADGLIVRNARYPKEVLEAGKRLKVIGRHGTGVDNIAMKEAELLGIQVVNGPTVNINTVAGYTVGLVLALSCGLVQADRKTRAKDWTYRLSMERYEIKGKTLGLVGFGRIGQLVTDKVISALGMDVIAYDIHSNAHPLSEIRFTGCLDEISYEADFVFPHIPSTPETGGMFDCQLFSMMKKGAYLINCARGDVYVKEDLVRILKEGHLNGAALDVYSQEPLKDSPLLSTEQVILPQHNPGPSEESKDRMLLYAAMGVDEVLTGRTPTWPVNKPQKQKIKTRRVKTARKNKRSLAFAMGMTLAVGMTACGSREAAPRTTAAAAQDSQAEDSREDKSKDSAPAGKEAAPAISETTYNWKWGTVDSTSNPNYEAMEYFCALLDEKASGKWSIQIYPDSQLGDASQLCESVQMGTLGVACLASSIVVNYAPDYGVFDMPYLFITAEEMDAALDGEVGAELAALADSANMKLVAWREISFRCLANNARPINSVEDVKGLRLRVISDEVHQAFWTALGTDPVSMSLSDAYMANQNGTIDGQDDPLHSLIASSTFEVCHCITVTNHVYNPLGAIASPKARTSMSPEDQELFMECMKEATANQKKLVREQNERAAKELEEKGCEVTYPQLQPFADKMEVVYGQYPQFSAWLDKIKWDRCSMYDICNMYDRGDMGECVRM